MQIFSTCWFKTAVVYTQAAKPQRSIAAALDFPFEDFFFVIHPFLIKGFTWQIQF